MPSILGQWIHFVHPTLAVAGLVGASIPIVIHLINRSRRRRMEWAAMAFLLAATRRSKRRLFLEQWVLLLARVAVMALLGLAVARPFLRASSIPLVGGSRAIRIVLIDDSLSMRAAGQGATTRFDHAQEAARRLLESFSPNDAVSMLTLPAAAKEAAPNGSDGPAGVGDDPAFSPSMTSFVEPPTEVDPLEAQGMIARLEPTFQTAPWPEALRRVEEIASGSDVVEGNRFAYILTDLAKPDWGGTDPLSGASLGREMTGRMEALSASARVTILAVGDAGQGSEQGQRGEPPFDNLAVTRLVSESSLVGVGFPAAFEVEVSNFGPRSGAGRLQLLKGDRIVHEFDVVDLAPDEAAVFIGSILFEEPGVYGVEARLTPKTTDVLKEDDVAYRSVEARETVGVLIVDGRPGATPWEGQAGYLATALAPLADTGGLGLFTPNVITELEFDAQALEDFDLVAMCNVRRLNETTWSRLRDFVAGGGGLWIFAGDQLAIDHYNRYGYDQGRGLLPGPFGAEAPAGGRGWTTLALNEVDHPMVAELAPAKDSGLFLARVERYVSMEPTSEQARIPLRYGDGGAALIVAPFGRGRVAVMTTTANMEWNNLAGKGDYVSLMVNVASRLIPIRGAARNLITGQEAREPLSTESATASLRAADARGSVLRARLRHDPQTDALFAQTAPIDRPGFVHLEVGPRAFLHAVNPPLRESVLRRATPEAARELVGPKVEWPEHAREASERAAAGSATDLSAPSLWVLLLLLFGESFLATALGRQARPSSRSDRFPRAKREA